MRIGTAEIYRALDDLDSIRDAVAIGLRRGDDEDIVLFVVLAEGDILTDAMGAHATGSDSTREKSTTCTKDHRTSCRRTPYSQW